MYYDVEGRQDKFCAYVMENVTRENPAIQGVDRLLLHGMFERGMSVEQAVHEIITHYISTDFVTFDECQCPSCLKK